MILKEEFPDNPKYLYMKVEEAENSFIIGNMLNPSVMGTTVRWQQPRMVPDSSPELLDLFI